MKVKQKRSFKDLQVDAFTSFYLRCVAGSVLARSTIAQIVGKSGETFCILFIYSYLNPRLDYAVNQPQSFSLKVKVILALLH